MIARALVRLSLVTLAAVVYAAVNPPQEYIIAQVISFMMVLGCGIAIGVGTVGQNKNVKTDEKPA